MVSEQDVRCVGHEPSRKGMIGRDSGTEEPAPGCVGTLSVAKCKVRERAAPHVMGGSQKGHLRWRGALQESGPGCIRSLRPLRRAWKATGCLNPLGNGVGRVLAAHPIQNHLPLVGVIVGERLDDGVALLLFGPESLNLRPQMVLGSPFLVFVGALLPAGPASSTRQLSVALGCQRGTLVEGILGTEENDVVPLSSSFDRPSRRWG